MWIKDEITDSYHLGKHLWGQAVGTWEEIENAGKGEQAMQYFEEIFCDQEAIDITTINDILAYDNDDLMEYLGLNEDEDKEWYIVDDELKTLISNGVLSEAHINVIKENFECGFHTVTKEEFENAEELSDEEIEELNTVVA